VRGGGSQGHLPDSVILKKNKSWVTNKGKNSPEKDCGGLSSSPQIKCAKQVEVDVPTKQSDNRGERAIALKSGDYLHSEIRGGIK